MTKFSTTSSNLFKSQNKEYIPEWMEKVADNLMVKDHNVEFDVEKRGIFAENHQVYRPELNADPRYLAQNYDDSRLISESKIELAKFLSGKYYKVVNATTGIDFVTLEVKIDSVPANFYFPYEVNNSKLNRSASFNVNEGEYPFSKAGLNECLSDIKNGIVKAAAPAEAIGKYFTITREEIVRRFNGSLREATDKINQLLTEGSIIGAGSNTYATFINVDNLFPQMQKEASEERLPEFHYVDNREHVASNEFKSANVLSIEASKMLSDYFNDFFINSTVRDNKELLVKATILGGNGIKTSVDFSFAIENEKLLGIKLAEVDNDRMTIEQLLQKVDGVSNDVLNKYLSNKQASKHIYSGIILTKKDIRNKLLKIVESNKIDSVINNWTYSGLITPVNSTTFATQHSFEELLKQTSVEALSDEAIEEIESAQRHFGEGLDLDTTTAKPNDEVRDIEDSGNEQNRLVNANNFINKHLKHYKVSSFESKGSNLYQLNIEFVNSKSGTRHKIPFNIEFEGSKVSKCTAFVNGKNVGIQKLAEVFSTNKVLSLYLQDNKDNLTAGPIVISVANMKRRLSSVVTASKVEEVLQNWMNSNDIIRLDEKTLMSEKSFEELLSTVDDNDILTSKEQELVNYQTKTFGKEIKIKNEDHLKDTGVREVEEQEWSQDRKKSHAASELSMMFKDFTILNDSDDEEVYASTATVRNPISGTNVNLTFKFAKSEGKISNIVAVKHEDFEEVPVTQLVELFEKCSSETAKHFAEYNKVSNRGYSNNLISKANLVNQLKVVASENNVALLIDNLVSKGFLTPINSVTYASNSTVAELVNVAASTESDKISIEDGKEQMSLSKRDNHLISLSNNHVKVTDSRKLDSTVRELNSQMIEAKDKLCVAVRKAEASKKMTSRKSQVLLDQLENSKTAQDLETVAKILKGYLN